MKISQPMKKYVYSISPEFYASCLRNSSFTKEVGLLAFNKKLDWRTAVFYFKTFIEFLKVF